MTTQQLTKGTNDGGDDETHHMDGNTNTSVVRRGEVPDEGEVDADCASLASDPAEEESLDDGGGKPETDTPAGGATSSAVASGPLAPGAYMVFPMGVLHALERPVLEKSKARFKSYVSRLFLVWCFLLFLLFQNLKMCVFYFLELCSMYFLYVCLSHLLGCPR